MRGVLVVLLISVVAALPMAVALGSTTVAVPDEQVTVPGVHQDVDSSQYAPEGPSASGSLQTKDATIHVSGPGCTVDPTHKIASGQVTSCRGGSVRGADAVDPDLVEAKIGLSLGGAAPAPAARHATPLAIAGAAVASVVANPTVLLAAAAASVSVVGLYALWRALKWTGLFALLPLYSHISDGEILDDENRANIYRLIQAEPGISTKDVATRLGLAWGTVTHHLGKLEKRRFVVSKKYGKYRERPGRHRVQGPGRGPPPRPHGQRGRAHPLAAGHDPEGRLGRAGRLQQHDPLAREAPRRGEPDHEGARGQARALLPGREPQQHARASCCTPGECGLRPPRGPDRPRPKGKVGERDGP